MLYDFEETESESPLFKMELFLINTVKWFEELEISTVDQSLFSASPVRTEFSHCENNCWHGPLQAGSLGTRLSCIWFQFMWLSLALEAY
jgi:hypothetical protein